MVQGSWFQQSLGAGNSAPNLRFIGFGFAKNFSLLALTLRYSLSYVY